LVPPPDGALDGEDVDGEPPAGGEGSGVLVAGGGVVVGGDADGGRSPGRSPIRSLRDSEQPAIRVAPVRSAVTAMSNFFIGFYPPEGMASALRKRLQAQCHRNAALIH
jgi:hypothetical protein